MTAFADVADYVKRTGATVEDEQTELVNTLLDDASEHLREIIGAHVFPQETSAIDLYQYGGDRWLTIPVRPLISIGWIKVDGVVRTDLTVADDAIQICGPARVEVEVTYGFENAPKTLISHCVVMVSQAMKLLKELGTLGSGEVSSVSIDDYQKAYKSGEDRTIFDVPERTAKRLRSVYGPGTVHVVGAR